ncbi:hypothetical protein BDK51DRAFT_49684 [Blyttiomyces helicus]|uniref:Uncharacterized protein n=1 Tax=Blyttiomyces helicus TaxID=388810 RepID=A0A4P9VZI0_9FUNG|nr:hypothetical protein BDK51DRAFT_49684 [Blyttiomyces helicus]|eukprot:RKO83778.1 hypothetical protein BDK51DRAFT_49684 [Blyttiomyces helicus]
MTSAAEKRTSAQTSITASPPAPTESPGQTNRHLACSPKLAASGPNPTKPHFHNFFSTSFHSVALLICTAHKDSRGSTACSVSVFTTSGQIFIDQNPPKFAAAHRRPASPFVLLPHPTLARRLPSGQSSSPCPEMSRPEMTAPPKPATTSAEAEVQPEPDPAATVLNIDPAVSDPARPARLVLYKRRYGVAAAVFLANVASAGCWSTYAAVTDTAQVHFQTSSFGVNWCVCLAGWRREGLGRSE